MHGTGGRAQYTLQSTGGGGGYSTNTLHSTGGGGGVQHKYLTQYRRGGGGGGGTAQRYVNTAKACRHNDKVQGVDGMMVK